MSINFLSELTGSFAMPARENPTVAMIESAYRHHKLDWRYINCEVAPKDLANAVAGARAMGWAGFNCSLPHKVAIIEHLDGLGESAKVIGAVNCAVRRNGVYIGENTDGKGFLQSLLTKINPAGKSAIIFGAGGAARACAVEMALSGLSSIWVVNRDLYRGRILADLINSKTKAKAHYRSWDGEYTIPENIDIVVNATSIGLFPDIKARVAVKNESLRPSLIIADIIPNPPRTRLVEEATARGCHVIDGLGMLINQGVISIKYWTGIDVDAGVMRKTVEEIFER
ncbi:MAG: shikimate dehydrogenase [Alphaproteobacteria bacterium]|nr:shikimate dehydrogenase [Alphaproteobacteria bacterium]